MRNSCIVLTLIMAVVAMAADAPKPLKDVDRLQIRDAQLTLAQAHIARLQAEAQVVAGEARISQIVQTLKTQYACPDCALNNDFTWTPAPPATVADTVAATVAATPAPPAMVEAAPSSAAAPAPKEQDGKTKKKKE